MDKITDVRFQPIQHSKYVAPFRVFYSQNNPDSKCRRPNVCPTSVLLARQWPDDAWLIGSAIWNGQEKIWDVMKSHGSVSILIRNVTRDVFVFVRQFRPAVYVNRTGVSLEGEASIDTSKFPGSMGVTWELCAGLIDKDLPLAEIAAEEVMEECGYKVEPANLEKISTFRSGVGLSGTEQTMYYVEVTDAMRTGPGGGNPEEGELIEVVEVPVQEALSFALDVTKAKPVGMVTALLWFVQMKSSSASSQSAEY